MQAIKGCREGGAGSDREREQKRRRAAYAAGQMVEKW